MDDKKISVVLLCGGKSERCGERPKLLMQIGDKAILYHVMNIYHNQGFNNFILSLGWHKDAIIAEIEKRDYDKFNITTFDSGLNTNTAGRIKAVKHLIIKRPDKLFLCNYADGLANVNIAKTIDELRKSLAIALMTVVRERSPFSKVLLYSKKWVKAFVEKPFEPYFVNGGFFVFSLDVLKYIKTLDYSLEYDVLPLLAAKKKLLAYQHHGFWATANTIKDFNFLNNIYREKGEIWLK